MDKGISVFICLIILTSELGLVTCKTCVKKTNCKCEFDDGSGIIDLTPLGHTDGTPTFADKVATGDSYWYSYSPCGTFNDVSCVNVAACQYDPLNYLFYDIGVPDSVTFNYDGNNVIAQYQSADGTRKTFVKLVCNDKLVTPTLDVAGETATTEYHMTLTAADVCLAPSSDSSGLSGGSVLLIIFFVLLSVYLIVGITFNKVKRDSRGLELVPNMGFWGKLPSLIRDGCAFSMAIVCRKRTVYVSM